MVLRRVSFYLFVVIVLLGLAWAAAIRFTRPIDEPARTGAARFETEVAEGEAPAPSTIDYARLDARLQQLMAEPQMVGLAVAVIENGRIRFAKGYGETIAGSGDPVTTATVFRWASLSKGVAADMVALLAGEGRLSLSDPVAMHAPSLRLPAGSEQVATVADLLSHRLGLFGHAQDSKLEDGLDARWLRGSLATLHNICAPGTCHAYQNVAYDAASEIVEHSTGRPYRDVVRERLFAPLGMNGASVTRAELMAAPSWARPHRGGKTSRPVEVTDNYYRVPAAGGVNGSIEDLAIWLVAQTGATPEILPANVLRAVQTPIVPTPGETRRRREYHQRTPTSAYGLGWRIFDYAGHRVIGHHGGVTGYRSLILFDPVRKTGVVALWNSGTGMPNGLEYEVMDMAYQLPFRDWLELDTPREGERPASPGESAENEGEGR